MMIGAGMPKKNTYIVKLVDKRDEECGRYYNGFGRWSGLNNAMAYPHSYLGNLSLHSGVHELFKIEENGTLTKIR